MCAVCYINIHRGMGWVIFGKMMKQITNIPVEYWILAWAFGLLPWKAGIAYSKR